MSEGEADLWVFCAQWVDGSLSLGITRDPAERLRRINRGDGVDIKRDGLPAYFPILLGTFTTVERALRAKAEVLRLGRPGLLRLIQGDTEIIADLRRDLERPDLRLQAAPPDGAPTVPARPEQAPGLPVRSNPQRTSKTRLEDALRDPSLLEQFLLDLVGPRTNDMVLRRFDGQTLEEVGRAYGLTRERIRQLVRKTGRRLGAAFNRSPTGKLLAAEVDRAIQEEGFAPANLATWLEATTGHVPEGSHIALLWGMLGLVVPSLSKQGTKRGSRAASSVGASQVAAAIQGLKEALARAILACIASMPFGLGAKNLAAFLTGKPRRQFVKNGLMQHGAFGALGAWSQSRLHDALLQLLDQGLLVAAESQYPVLTLTPTGQEVVAGTRTATIGTVAPPRLSETEGKLFESLAHTRGRLAVERGRPPFAVCTDLVLYHLSRMRPTNMDELWEVPGVGAAFCESFGEAFLETLEGVLGPQDRSFGNRGL